MNAQTYTQTERFMLDNNLALLDGIVRCISNVDAELTAQATVDEDARLLMTIPGINIVIAVGLLAEIADIKRFSTPQLRA